jgi:hypothetical protein
MAGFELSVSQKEAINSLRKHDVLNLCGPAGTGKTTVIVEWIKDNYKLSEPGVNSVVAEGEGDCNHDELLPKKGKYGKYIKCIHCNLTSSWPVPESAPFVQINLPKYEGVVFLAPTHQAVSVIKEMLDQRDICVDVKTVSSFLGYRKVINPNTAKEEFRPVGKWVYQKKMKIVNSKPVEMNDTSKDQIYRESFDARTNGMFYYTDAKEKTKYTTVVVDESSMLTPVHVRELLEYQKEMAYKLVFAGDHYQLPPVGYPLAFPIKDIPTAELKEQHRAGTSELNRVFELLRDLVRTKGASWSGFNRLLPQGDSIKVVETLAISKETPLTLSWRNKVVDKYNHNIRECCIGKSNMSQLFASNDKVRAARNLGCFEVVKLGEKSVRAFGEKCKNGESHMIASVNRTKISSFVNPKQDFPIWEIQFVGEAKLVQFIDREHKESVNYIKSCKEVSKEIIDKDTDPDKRKGLLKKLEDLNRLGNKSQSLKHAYAMTVHKSQGSTFDDVAVDVNDILQAFDPICEDIKWRLLYVAASRARKSITFIL